MPALRVLISHRPAVRFVVLVIAVQVDARCLTLALKAVLCTVPVHATNLTKFRRTIWLSAADELGLAMPMRASVVQAWVLIGAGRSLALLCAIVAAGNVLQRR